VQHTSLPFKKNALLSTGFTWFSSFKLLNAMRGTKHIVLPCGTDLEVEWTDGRKTEGRNS
jgi:hypothetical protein